MPMQRHLYPKNWDGIAHTVKSAANWQCQGCGRRCRQVGESYFDFLMRLNPTLAVAIAMSEHPARYILTTAHLNHLPHDCRFDNLRALCSACHCRMDLKAIPLKQQLKRERAGQLHLFDLVPPDLAGHGKDGDRVQLPIREQIP